jgi:hypothetical protein
MQSGKGAAPGWGIISTPLPLSQSGRIMIAKPGDRTRRRSTKCQSRMTEPMLSAGKPRSRRHAPLEANPKKLPHPRRQVEGGDVAGYAEQFQTKGLPGTKVSVCHGVCGYSPPS